MCELWDYAFVAGMNDSYVYRKINQYSKSIRDQLTCNPVAFPCLLNIKYFSLTHLQLP
jgi:hypothetical protein